MAWRGSGVRGIPLPYKHSDQPLAAVIIVVAYTFDNAMCHVSLIRARLDDIAYCCIYGAYFL